MYYTTRFYKKGSTYKFTKILAEQQLLLHLLAGFEHCRYRDK